MSPTRHGAISGIIDGITGGQCVQRMHELPSRVGMRKPRGVPSPCMLQGQEMTDLMGHIIGHLLQEAAIGPVGDGAADTTSAALHPDDDTGVRESFRCHVVSV